MNIDEFFEVFTGGNSNIATWTPYAVKKFAVDYRKQQLTLTDVIVSEMRTSKEIIRLIELVDKIETEQSNKCVDMKLRDIVNTSFYRLKKVFNK